MGIADKELEEIKGKIKIIGIMVVLFIVLYPLKDYLDIFTRAVLSVVLSPLVLYGIFKFRERKPK